MKNEIEKQQTEEIQKGLQVTKDERELLIKEFETVSKLEITEENLPKFKALRLKIVKNRTQGINEWHKKGKEVSLRLGQLYDSIKKEQSAINKGMEDKLFEAEKFFENREKERLEDLHRTRAEQVSPYIEDLDLRDFSGMEEDVWKAFFETKKKNFEEAEEAARKAEEERIKQEEAEAARQKKIEAENKRLKEEAEKREKKIQEERKKEAEERRKAEETASRIAAEKIKQAQEEAKKEAEEKEAIAEKLRLKEEAEAKKEADRLQAIEDEAKKGDEDKVKDLITDLEGLKNKYSFKSKKYIKMYSDVNVLIDKVVNHINK